MNNIIEFMDVCSCCRTIICAGDEYTIGVDGYTCIKCLPIKATPTDSGFFSIVALAVLAGTIFSVSTHSQHSSVAIAQTSVNQGAPK